MKRSLSATLRYLRSDLSVTAAGVALLSLLSLALGGLMFLLESPEDAAMMVTAIMAGGGALLTLCVQGRVVLNLESARGFFQIGLPFSFEECVPSRAGEFFLLESRTAFALIGDDGEVRALSEGRVTERGARVTAEIPLHDSLGHIVRRTWENGAAGDCAVLSAREPAEATFALAFFESLLTGSDPEPWLSPSLAPKKGLLRQFLGDFRRAVLTEKTDVVGLVYARKPRVFDVRRFRVTVEEGKIANIAAEEP